MRIYSDIKRTRPRVYFDDQSIAPGFSGNVFLTSYDNTTTFSDEFRTWLFNIQNGRCGYCGDILGDTWENNKLAHVEHIQRKMDGGSDFPPNIMYACRPCNHQKGAHHYSTLRIRIPLRRAGAAGLIQPAKAKVLINMGLLAIQPLEQFHFESCNWPHVKPPAQGEDE